MHATDRRRTRWGFLPIVLALAVPPAGAELLTVCTNGCDFATVQGAIQAAAPGDTIRIAQTAPHTEADIVVFTPVTIEGLAGVTTTLQAASSPGSLSGRLLTIPAGVTVLVRDLVLRYGSVAGPGAGIHNQGDLTLERVELRDNATDDSSFPDRLGGAIYNASSVRLRDSLVHYNFASRDGGAIYNAPGATFTATDTDFHSNQAGQSGGHLSNDGDATLIRCQLSQGDARVGGAVATTGSLLLSGYLASNHALDAGGALLVSGGSVEVANAYFYQNNAAVGGGAYVQAGAAAFAGVTLQANTAESGAALAHFSPVTLDLVNVTIGGNTASNHGGGIFLGSPRHIKMSSSTVAGNLADSDSDGNGDGGGIYIAPCSGTCPTDFFRVRNSILADNLDGSPSGPFAHDCSGALTSEGYVLVETGSTGSVGTCRVIGDLTGVVVESDPSLEPIDENGGTPTYTGGSVPPTQALSPGSLAIDAGDPAGCLDGDGGALPRDERGADRVGFCDLGSYEADGVPRLFADGFESGDTLFWRTP